MEFLLQYLDDLDDLFGMLGLVVERARRAAIVLFSYAAAAIGAAAGVWVAQHDVPLAMGISMLLFVALLYRKAIAAYPNPRPIA